MAERRNDELTLLREGLRPAEDSLEAERHARARLRGSMAGRRRRTRPAMLTAASATVGLVVVVAWALIAPGGVASPAAQAFEELADATERQPASELGPGVVVTVRSQHLELVRASATTEVSDGLAFQVAYTREVSTAPDEPARVTATVEAIHFLRPGDAEEFEQAGLDEVYPVGGEPRAGSLAGVQQLAPAEWPPDGDELAAAMRRRAADLAVEATVPGEVAVLLVAEQLLDPAALAGPEFRSAVLQALSNAFRDAQSTVERSETAIRIELVYQTAAGQQQRRVTFDRETARLSQVEDVLIAAAPASDLASGTVLLRVNYQLPVLIEES